jgi:Ring finger domain
MMRSNRLRVFDPNWINYLIVNVPQRQTQAEGMDKNSLNSIKKIKFQKVPNLKEEEEEKCPVCLLEFEDQEQVKQLPCGHLFHEGCIDSWLVRNSKCPICKRDVKEGLNQNP